MPSTDPDFIRYATTGNGDAFRALVSAHLGMVIAVAVRRLGPHAHLAPDVAQGVFTRLARVARGLPRDLIVAPWLHRQAVRLAIDAVRKEERRLRRETTAAMLHAPDSTPPPAETALLVDEALDQLPAADRTVLVLRYLEDRDFESVAQSLGSTPEAARKRIARSLEKLRALLTRRGTALSLTALTAFLTEQSAHAAPAALTARISASALQSAATTGNTAAILTTALISHATALATGALAALLACGLFYQQREKEMAQSASASLIVQAERAHMSHRPDRSDATDSPVPATLPEIIDALVKITDGPDTVVAHERITRLLRLVPPEQYLEFYLNAEPRIHPLRWQHTVFASVGLWKMKDPAMLTRALVESDRRKEFEMMRLKYTGQADLNLFSCSRSSIGVDRLECFSEWLKVEPNEALAWLRAERNVQPVSHVFEHLARAAIRIAGTNPFKEWPGTVAGTEYYCLERCDTDGGLVKALQDASSPAERKALVHHAYRNVIAKDVIADAKRAIQLAPEHERFDLSLALLPADIWQRPGNAPEPTAEVQFQKMNEALAMAGELPRTEAVTRLVVSRLSPEDGHGPDELMTWVRSLAGTETSEVIQAGARTLAAQNYNDQIALQWAAAVPDAAQRGPLLRGIYLRWQDADPAAAQKFLTTAPADIAAELQALTPEAP